MIRKYRNIWILFSIALFFVACSERIEPPSGVSDLPPQPETPRGAAAAIGSGSISLSWNITDASEISQYLIYYSSISADDVELFDSTENSPYEISGLSNGVAYYFKVSAVSLAGLEGEMSQVVSASPGVFSLVIGMGEKYTKDRSIRISLTAPVTSKLVQLSEDSDFTSGSWENYSPSKTFLLSNSDGTKYVYGRFQLENGGSSSDFVTDSIVLDRYAIIDSVTENSNGNILEVGNIVHLSVYASEIEGFASLSISGIGRIDLNDFGLNGDLMANDGIYSIDYIIPIATELIDAEISGEFIDAAGNQAAEVKAVTKLNAAYPPEPAALTGYAESSWNILLQWTRPSINDFASYRLFRSESANVDDNSQLVATITNQSTTSYDDIDLVDSITYYYRLYVYDQRGAMAGSNEISVVTLKNTSPEAVSIAVTLTGDALTAEVSWLQSPDDDFESYHLLRNTSPLSDYNSSMIIRFINDIMGNSFIDNVPIAGTYYYQVYVFDKQGEMTGSNVVSIIIP